MTTGLINFVANGTVTVNTQSNITSVGTLAQLSVAGNSNLGAVGNVHITGGSANYVLITDGSGNLSWVAGGNVTGNGTVTNVNTSGSGLGFTLTGGPITTTGTVTLTVPNAATLRTNLTIGNVANLNLNGNGSTYLAGNGSFTVPDGTYSNSNVASYLPTYTGNIGSFGSRINYLYANVVNGTTVTGTNGNFTTSNIAGNLTANNVTITNILSGNVGNFTGNLGNLAKANYFQGDGSLLTNLPIPNYANFAGTLINGNSNVRISANSNVTVSVAGNSNVITFTGTGANITGTLSSSGNLTAGNAQLGNLATANYLQGTLITSAQPNITSVGTLANLSVTGNINSNGIVSGIVGNFVGNSSTLSQTIINAGENVTVVASGATGTINFNVTSQSLVYYTANASNNWTINFQGSNGSSLNDVLPSNNSITVAFLAKIGNTGYFANNHTIDGVTVTPLWQGNSSPTLGDVNSIDAYTYSIIKTAANTYTVLAAITQYK